MLLLLHLVLWLVTVPLQAKWRGFLLSFGIHQCHYEDKAICKKETQIHKLTEVQSHSLVLVLVFVTMQGGLSPAAQTCVHAGALEC